MMKNINNITLLLVALFASVSCQNSDYVEPTSLTKSFSLYASFFNTSSGINLDPTYAQTSELIGIKDLSQGTLSHEWSFWYGNVETGTLAWEQMESGISFIEENSPLGYNTITDYSPYVDSSISPTNDLAALSFVYETGGRYKLKIRNTYDKQVRYYYSMVDPIDGVTIINEYIDAVDLGDGTYEIEREYEFMVFDRFDPSCIAYYDPECTEKVDLTPTATYDEMEVTEITINMGETLTLVDTTGIDENGESTIYSLPSARIWTWEYEYGGIDEDITPTVEPTTAYSKYQDFVFDEVGTYTVKLYVVRNEPDYYVTTFYPTVGATEVMPILVHVVDPSDAPSVTPL